MHALDITIVVVLGIAALNGARLGLLQQFIRLMTYVAAVYGTIYFHQPVVDLILDKLGEHLPAQSRTMAANTAAYVVTFPLLFAGLVLATVAVRHTCRGLLTTANPTASHAAPSLFPRFVDRAAGAVVGVMLAGLIVGGGLAILSMAPLPKLEEKLAGSKLRLPLVQSAQAVAAAIPQQYKDEFNAAIERLKAQGTATAGDLLAQGLQGVTHEVNNLADGLRTRFTNGTDSTRR